MHKSRKFNFLIIILVFGLLFGGSLIGFGVYKDVSARILYNEKNNSINDLKNSIEEIDEQLNLLKNDLNNEFDDNGFSDEFYDINEKIESLKSKREEYKVELEKVVNGFYKENSNKKSSLLLYFLGILFIVVSVFGFIFNFNKKRKKKVKGKKKKED